jgi:hypothetical protein
VIRWRNITLRPGITLGIVSGRRRQGKSMLLHAVAEAAGGFYYPLINGNETEILQDLGVKVSSAKPCPFE